MRSVLLTALLLALASPAAAEDVSANSPTISTITGGGAVLLASKRMLPKDGYLGHFFAQNQSAVRVWIVVDDGESTATDGSDKSQTIFVLDPGVEDGAQGGSISDEDVGPVGRIRVYGPSGSHVAVSVK